MTGQEKDITENVKKTGGRSFISKAFAALPHWMPLGVTGLFIISPFLQLLVRFFFPNKLHYVVIGEYTYLMPNYQRLIELVNRAACIVAILFYIYCIYYAIARSTALTL